MTEDLECWGESEGREVLFSTSVYGRRNGSTCWRHQNNFIWNDLHNPATVQNLWGGILWVHLFVYTKSISLHAQFVKQYTEHLNTPRFYTPITYCMSIQRVQQYTPLKCLSHPSCLLPWSPLLLNIIDSFLTTHTMNSTPLYWFEPDVRFIHSSAATLSYKGSLGGGSE